MDLHSDLQVSNYICTVDSHRGHMGDVYMFNYTSNEICDLQDVPAGCLCEYAKNVVDCQSTSRIPYLEGPYCTFADVSLALTIIHLRHDQLP